MNKSLYYIECTCIKECSCPNIDFHVGDVFYFNKKAASNEMYLSYSYKNKRYLTEQEKDFVGVIFGKYTSHIPFTRQKRFAKKWEIKRYADWEAMLINEKGIFNAVVKEIKVTYEEEEL